jgi:hypothetical protein
MSIKVRSIMAESPRAFQVLNKYVNPIRQEAGSSWEPSVEASPIYEELTAEVSISGSYTDGNIDYDYSYTGSKTWTRVPMVGDSSLWMNKIYDDVFIIYINGVQETLEASVGVNIYDIATDGFIMALYPALEMTSGDRMFAPAYPAALIYPGSAIEESVIIGTQTNNAFSPPVVTDIIGTPSVFLSFGYASTPTDPRFIFDLFRISGGIFLPENGGRATIDEDTSVWSPAKWRDFRGTYSATEVDTNGITTTLDVILA